MEYCYNLARLPTLVLLPAGRQILIFILRIGAIHVRRFLLGIILQNRIVLLIFWLSPFHRHRVQLAVQATLHVRHTAHLCGLVVRFLAITEVQSQGKPRVKKGGFNPEVRSRHRDDEYPNGDIQKSRSDLKDVSRKSGGFRHLLEFCVVLQLLIQIIGGLVILSLYV